MRAVVLERFGPPEVLAATDVPDPVPGPGQVVVEVRIANVTFVETQLRAGRPPNPAMEPRLPAILGNGVGGVVAEVAAGADPALLGQRVITSLGGSGGYAERAAVDAAALISVPEALDLPAAVALLSDGRTALAQLQAAAPQAGETVLVEAAAGGVGSLLVQLARNAGARVVAAAGGSRKLSLAAELGATVVVDYTDGDWPDQVRAKLAGLRAAGAAGPEDAGVDVVFDGVGGTIGQAALGLLRDGGRFCAFGMASGSFTQLSGDEAAQRNLTIIRGRQLTPQQMRDLTTTALTEAAADRLRPVIGQTFPLERAADAHAAIEQRATVGKTLLLVDRA